MHQWLTREFGRWREPETGTGAISLPLTSYNLTVFIHVGNVSSVVQKPSTLFYFLKQRNNIFVSNGAPWKNYTSSLDTLSMVLNFMFI